MATSEPSRSDDGAEIGAPPELPEEKPQRFQFSLKQLLGLMLASALLAIGVRWVLLRWSVFEGSGPANDIRRAFGIMRQLPDKDMGIPITVCIGVAFGALLYLFLRAPFLAAKARRINRRWSDIQQHRRDLKAWGEARKREQAAQSESGDMQRLE